MFPPPQEGGIHMLGFVHHHPDGRPMFHHRALWSKYPPHRVDRILRLAYLVLQPKCPWLAHNWSGPFTNVVRVLPAECVAGFEDIGADLRACKVEYASLADDNGTVVNPPAFPVGGEACRVGGAALLGANPIPNPNPNPNLT